MSGKSWVAAPLEAKLTASRVGGAMFAYLVLGPSQSFTGTQVWLNMQYVQEGCACIDITFEVSINVSQWRRRSVHRSEVADGQCCGITVAWSAHKA